MTRCRPTVLLLLSLFCLVQWVPHASAKRIALVVGNGSYQHLPALRNTANDANAIARSLEYANFEVTKLIDADLISMKRAFLAFGRAMREDVEATFIFYAGHGVQVSGENYLMPVDANVSFEDEVAIEGVNANDFLRVLNGSRGAVNIVVLDACRNNPFPSSIRSATAGLAPVLAPRGTLIAYSTAPGSVAWDGGGEHSDFTAALAETMRMPGLEIAQVFRKVRGRVLERTDGKQTPWESSSIIGEFYFVPPAATAIAPAEAGVSPYLAAATRWKELEASTDTAALEAFAKQYEDNLFGAAARARLSQIAGQRSTSATDEAKTASPLPAPSSERQFDAPEMDLATLPPPGLSGTAVPPRQSDSARVKQALDAARKINTARAWQLFLARYGQEKDAGDAAFEALRGLATAAGAAPSATELERALQLSASARTEVQGKLAALGYSVGKIDGAFGDRTRSGIADYQQSLGLPATGWVDLNVLHNLGIRWNGIVVEDFKSGSRAKVYDADLLELLGEDARVVEVIRCLPGRSIVYGRFRKHVYAAANYGPASLQTLNSMLRKCNSHLVSISDRAENTFVYDLVAEEPIYWTFERYREHHNKHGPLLGLVQRKDSKEPSGGWQWSDGDLSSFRRWDSGQPDNYNNIEHSTQFWGSALSSASLKNSKADLWNDFPYDGGEFIIEHDSGG